MISALIALWLIGSVCMLQHFSSEGRDTTEALAFAAVSVLWPIAWIVVVTIGPMARLRARCRGVGR